MSIFHFLSRVSHCSLRLFRSIMAAKPLAVGVAIDKFVIVRAALPIIYGGTADIAVFSDSVHPFQCL